LALETILGDSFLLLWGFVRLFMIVIPSFPDPGPSGSGPQAYDEKADEVLSQICDALKKKPGIVDVQIHHLVGKFEVGEDLVYVLVAGAHRQQVFPVLEEAVERYKKEAPIFKKELVATGKGEKKSYWTTEGKNGS